MCALPISTVVRRVATSTCGRVPARCPSLVVVEVEPVSVEVLDGELPQPPRLRLQRDRKTVASGKSVSVLVDLGCLLFIKKKILFIYSFSSLTFLFFVIFLFFHFIL